MHDAGRRIGLGHTSASGLVVAGACPLLSDTHGQLDGTAGRWARSLRVRLINQGIRSVGGEYPPAGDVDHVFVFEPEKTEVVNTLREVGLNDDVTRNHASGNERIVRAIVPVGFQL